MFYYIKDTFDNIVKSIDKYVIGENKFTRDSKFSFKDYVTFLCFNKGTSNQANLEDFIEDNFTRDIQLITRQAFSKQRTFINPLVFKEISKHICLKSIITKITLFLRRIKDFVCWEVMDLILKFQILKKFEMNSKLKTLKNTENQHKPNSHPLWTY